MAEVPSTFQLKPGSEAPDFVLPDARGQIHRLAELLSGQKGILVAFVCNHCPFVIHLARELGQLASELEGKGIGTVAINANDVAKYPADSPDRMVAFADENNWQFPYLFDETQSVAKSYAAACTPDFYLVDADLRLVYAGQFDGSRPGKGDTPDGADLRSAADALLSGRPSPEPWYPSTGCNIKWKPGNEPDYFTKNTI